MVTRRDSKKLTVVSMPREVVAAVAVTDLKANNAEVAAVEIVPRVNVVKVKSAVVAEVAIVVAVEEADHELLFLMVKTAPLLSVPSVEVKEKDTKESLVKKLIHSIAKTVLVVVEEATKRVATAEETGVTRHQSQRSQLQLKVKQLLKKLSQKEEKEDQERRRRKNPSFTRRKDSLLMTTSHKSKLSLQVFLLKKKLERTRKSLIRRFRRRRSTMLRWPALK